MSRRCERYVEILLVFALGLCAAAHGQTTTYTGTIRDLSNNAVTSGQVTWTLTPSSDTTISGTSRFVPTTIACNINGDGSLSGYVAGAISGPCVVASNTALSPGGTAYRVCIQPGYLTPGSCFFDYAVTGTRDISTVVPTLTTGPLNYGLAGSVINQPAAGQTVIQPPGTTLAISSLNTTTIDVDTFSGSDLGAKLAAAQNSLSGGKTAVLTINTAGTISSPFTLAAGNDLTITAPVSLAAVVTLAGSNHVSCAGGATLAITSTSGFSSAANNLSISGCTVTGDSGANTYLLTSNGSSHIKIEHNTATQAALVRAANGADLVAANNSEIWTSVGGYGVTWLGFSDVRVLGNSFLNVADPVEFFNADADPTHGTTINSRATVSTYGGRYLIEGNVCTNATACFWGSVAHDVSMVGNYAYNCGDVCYDLEGVIDGLVEGNRGDSAVTAVGSTFFFSDHNSFVGNYFTQPAASALIAIHNASQAPSNNEWLRIASNSLFCPNAVCTAVGGDPADFLEVSNNSIANGTITFGGYGGTTVIQRNLMVFGVAATTATNAIQAPNLINSAVLTVTDNTIYPSAGQPANSACIADASSDFNSTVQILITGNRCLGGFPVDLSTTNAGTNGGTGVATTVSGNWWGANNVTHTHTTGNVDQYVELDNFIHNGLIWRHNSQSLIRASITLTAATSDVATIAGLTTSAVCTVTPFTATNAPPTPFPLSYAPTAAGQLTIWHSGGTGVVLGIICTQ